MRNKIKKLVKDRELHEAMIVLRTLPPENAPQFVSTVALLGLKAKEISNAKERDEILTFAVTFMVTYGRPNMIRETMNLLECISSDNQENISFKNAIMKQLSIVVYTPISERM